ncbi:hypothetical protein ACTFIU_001972 [Dictyostelium citrinum]
MSNVSPNSMNLNGSTSSTSSVNDSGGGGGGNVTSPTLSSSSASSISNSNSSSSNNLKPSTQPLSSSSTLNTPTQLSLQHSSSSSSLNNTNIDIIEHITISYQDESSIWKYIEAELPNHLPLKNISWKTKTGHTKVVEKMPIEILQYNDERVKAHYDNQNLYKKPYLYLYLVHCDDPDTYKNVVRGKIKQWVTQMTERQQEWLIVYVSLGPKRFSELTSKLTRTVFDRIKNDFNVKRDRCCQLRFLDTNNSSSGNKDKDSDNNNTTGLSTSTKQQDDLWDDFLIKMKEGIISSAEQYLTTYEDEIRKMDAKRTTPGWSYQNFFFIKEGLALIYERAQLYEDALMQYFELEVLFTDPNNRSQFDQITDEVLQPNSIHCNGNILDTSFKNYRKLIHENKISLFDFKVYLFARQSKLLFLLQKPIEAATKSISFITSMSMIIKQYPNSFAPMFKESWIFSTSMELIKACQDSFDKVVNGAQQQQQQQQQLQQQLQQQQQQQTINGSAQKVVKSISSTTPISKLFGAFGPFGSSSNNTPSTSTTSTNGKNTPMPSNSGMASLSAGGSTIIAGLSGSQSLNNLQSAQLSGALNTQHYIRTPSLNLTSDLSERLTEKQDRESLDFLIGDLLFSSAQRLEELAIMIGYLPVDDYNSEMFFQIVDEVMFKSIENKKIEVDSMTAFSYQPLQVSLQSSKQFTQLYFELLGQIEKLYIQSNRMRSISRLTFAIANLNFKLKEFQIAENLFKSISNLYSREHWSYIEYAVKTRLSYCQKQLGHLVDYVTTCVGLLAPGLLTNKFEKDHYLSEIIKISQIPELNIVQPMIPLFKCKVTFKETVYRYLETIKINVRIKSSLISPIRFNNGAVSFIKSGFGDKMVFQLNDFVVEPGVNHFQFTAVGSTKATFVKDSIWLKIGNLSFGYSLRNADTSLSHQQGNDKLASAGNNASSTTTLPGEIKVIDSESQITLESFANSPLLFCSIQYVGIKLHTHSDTIEAGVLTFTSPSGATIIPTSSVMIIQSNDKTGESSSRTINLINDKLPLSQIGYNQTLEFYLPLMAVNTEACTHQIRIELQHQKQTKEKFSSSLVSSILFINPLTIDESVINVNNRLFLKTIIQCNTPNMIQFNSYSLEGCDLEYQSPEQQQQHQQQLSLSSSNSSISSKSSQQPNLYYLVKDHNHSLAPNLNLYPGQLISLIFEIKKYESESLSLSSPSSATDSSNSNGNNNNHGKNDMKLKIKYTSKMLQQDIDRPLIRECKSLWRDQNEFSWPIKIEQPTYLYQIDLSIQSKAYVGTFVPFEIEITNLKQQKESNDNSDEKQQQQQQQLQYHIVVDPQFWMISGKNKHSFSFNSDSVGEKLKFSCGLIPISSGSPPIPKVNLVGINNSNISYPKTKNEKIFIYPSPQIYSCHQLQDNSNNSNGQTNTNKT